MICCIYKKLLERFDLSIGEIFSYKENTYIVRDSGIYKRINAEKWIIDTELMADMLVGNITKVKRWRPSGCTDYYIFNTAYNKIEKIGWSNNKLDEWRLESGLVCKTKEEAEKLGKKLIDYLQQEY